MFIGEESQIIDQLMWITYTDQPESPDDEDDYVHLIWCHGQIAVCVEDCQEFLVSVMAI